MPLVKKIMQLSILVLFIGHAIPLWRIPLLETFERNLDDARTNLFLTEEVDPRIVIIDIDEASLVQFGQWPWSRYTMAELINQLNDHYQVNVIGFDMVFAEPTRYSDQFIQSLIENDYITINRPLNNVNAGALADRAFADAIRKSHTVAGFVFKHNDEIQINSLPPAITNIDNDLASDLAIPKPTGSTNNVDVIQQAATAHGFFDNPSIDQDGVYRRASLLQIKDDKLYPSLALAVTQLAISRRDDNGNITTLMPINIAYLKNATSTTIDSVQLGRYVLRPGLNGAIRIPFHASDQGFKYIPAADVITGVAPLADLKNKIVLLGTSAPGLKDIRSTATNRQLAGVEVHANIIAGILDNKIPVQPSYDVLIEIFQLIAASLILWFSFYSTRPAVRMFITLSLASIALAINLFLWQKLFILPIASTLSLIAVMYLLDTSWELLVENKNKRQITRIFGQYVPNELVAQIAEQPSTRLLSGEEKNLTVLFSDVRGFTSMSENLTPEQLSTLMNRLLTPLTKCIHHEQGTIDKYMGDAIMAFWGAPISEPEHANKAVAAALKMQDALLDLQKTLSEFGVQQLGMSIGLNTGLMSVGNMGSEFRIAYTVMGDAVNLGSRLEALTRQYGIDILVSETTKNEATQFAFKEIDRVRVKGKLEPVSIFEPISAIDVITGEQEQLMAKMTEALAHYRAQHWQEAQENFKALLKVDEKNSPLYRLYLERIEELNQQKLPDDWDGVYNYITK